MTVPDAQPRRVRSGGGSLVSRPRQPAPTAHSGAQRPACVGVDTERFFDPAQVRGLARDYCRDCPVRSGCGAEADRRGEVGLWGGLYRYRRTGLGPVQATDMLRDDTPVSKRWDTVEAEPVRAQLRVLLAHGWTQVDIADRVQRHVGSIYELLAARTKRVQVDTARRVFALELTAGGGP